MKNLNIIFLIFITVNSLAFSKGLFFSISDDYIISNKLKHHTGHSETELAAFNAFYFHVNTNFFDSIVNKDLESFNLDLSFLFNDLTSLELEKFSVFDGDLNIRRQTVNGVVKESYLPQLKTYKIKSNSFGLTGVFSFSSNGIKAIIKFKDQLYQISKFQTTNKKLQNIYFMINVEDSPIPFDFKCASDLIDSPHHDETHNYRLGSMKPCIHLAIDVDYFTFQTFNSYEEAIDWSLEIISVVNEIFSEQIDVQVISNNAQVWEVEDPYSNFIDDPQNMLSSLRDSWYSNTSLLNIERDLVHLFSKRSDTGTGGIAYLNGLGSNWNGYGFSSNLTDESQYFDLPVPYFFWNIYCLAHELGHNLGAKHTQWCGWEGGPIDNCASIEEMNPGECEDFIDVPQPSVGTIMSYCHTWPVNDGGGIIMQFHDQVKMAIKTYVDNHNLNLCDDILIITGCTDPLACNYNNQSNIDDNSCIFPVEGYDCNGNCLEDINNNDICDFEEIVDLDNVLFSADIYPNPANKYLNIYWNSKSTPNLYFLIVNNIGQVVLRRELMHRNNAKIDISLLKPGLYHARVLSKSNNTNIIEIISKNILVQ